MVTDLSQISVDFKVRDAFKFRKCKHSVECEDHLWMILQSRCSCFKDKRNDHTICFIRTTHKRHSKVDFIFLFLPFNAYTIFNLLHVDKCNNYILQSSDVSSRTKTNWESFSSHRICAKSDCISTPLSDQLWCSSASIHAVCAEYCKQSAHQTMQRRHWLEN